MSPRRCLEVADDTINGVLEIFRTGYSCSFLFANPLVVLVVFALASSFYGSGWVCSSGHLSYADAFFESVLYDTNDFGSDTLDSIRFQ